MDLSCLCWYTLTRKHRHPHLPTRRLRSRTKQTVSKILVLVSATVPWYSLNYGAQSGLLGTFDHTPPSHPPSTLWLYKDVGYGNSFPSAILFSFLQSFVHSAGSTLQVGPNCNLRGYVTSDYKEGEILKHPVNSPILFQEDITKLEEVTYWKISYDPATGIYRIQRD